MTCCVAVVYRHGAMVGADSMRSDSNAQYDLCEESKVWTSGAFLLAAAGSVRSKQIIQHNCPMPKKLPGNVLRYLVNDWATSVRKAFDKHEYAADTKASDLLLEGSMLIVTSGRIFTIDGDFGVTESRRDFAAIGSGESYALGSLFTSRGQPPRERVLGALRAAQDNCATVKAPFRVRAA